jgi:alpha-beta hydrolase superfamily lysophospholipase
MRSEIWRRESQIELSDVGERYRRSWLPAEPSQVMVLVHGYAEHTGRYDEMAMYFAERGFAVHAYDQVGHGRTAGPRGHVDRFDRLIEELARFVELVRLEHPGLPLTLVGHSMGGLVVAATAAFRHPEVEHIVLSGALLQLGGEAGGLRQSISLWIARMVSTFAPRVAVSTGLDLQGLSRDPEVIRRYEQDPFVKDRMSVRFAAGMSSMISAVRGAADRIERPILILHGGEDSLSPPAGSRHLYAGLRGEIVTRSALQIYPELRHEIFQEPEREQVWQDVQQWLESCSAPNAGIEGARRAWQTN